MLLAQLVCGAVHCPCIQSVGTYPPAPLELAESQLCNPPSQLHGVAPLLLSALLQPSSESQILRQSYLRDPSKHIAIDVVRVDHTTDQQAATKVELANPSVTRVHNLLCVCVRCRDCMTDWKGDVATCEGKSGNGASSAAGASSSTTTTNHVCAQEMDVFAG